MQKILRKRVLRDLKKNILRYLALSALIILGMYLVVSLVGAADTLISGTKRQAGENKIEDGEFSTVMPLSAGQKTDLTDEGTSLEEQFYLDYKIKDSDTLRVMKTREDINKIELDKGRQAKAKKEIVLEKRFAQEHNLTVGDQIKVKGTRLKIVGIGTVPDYDAPYKTFSDSSVDSKTFGIGFVNAGQYDAFKTAGGSIKAEENVYAYRLLDGEMTQKELKDKLKDTKLLTQFMQAKDNPRIGAAADDQLINKYAGLAAGVIIMILFTYVISVFVVHGIEKEMGVIGSLYAMGVKKKTLIIHYLCLPTAITLIAGIIGTMVGFSKWGINVQMQDCYNYYSVPDLATVYTPYLLAYGLVMPPVIAFVVNYFVIKKRLSAPVLQMLTGEQKNGKVSRLKLGSMGFVRRFQIRQMCREARSCFTVLFGMFVSMLILMLAMDCYVMCGHVSTDYKKDTKYEYMYTYKYPEEKVPKGGEEAYGYSLSKEVFGYDLDVTLVGIKQDNPYFDAQVPKGEDKVVLSSAMAQKYNLEKGSRVTLNDEENDKKYTFTVEGITQYSPGLYAFMNIDSMRKLFDKADDYYNVVFSDHKLDIDTDILYGVTSRADVVKSSDVFVNLMGPMVDVLVTVSALIFFIVMYLMMKVMIDRSSFQISLFKVFGYRMKEIRRLYLNGNFYIIAIGAAICIPLAKKAMDAMYPLLVSNVACGMNLTFTWQLYAIIYGGIILFYIIINQLLVGHLRKVTPAEVIKNRE